MAGRRNGVPAIPAKVIATCFALCVFAAATIVGAYAGNEARVVILTAGCLMIICYVVGLIVGGVAQRAVDEHARRHETEHPIPDSVEDLPVKDASRGRAAA